MRLVLLASLQAVSKKNRAPRRTTKSGRQTGCIREAFGPLLVVRRPLSAVFLRQDRGELDRVCRETAIGGVSFPAWAGEQLRHWHAMRKGA